MINKNISIMEFLQIYPGLAEVLKSMGMGCAQCMGASTESLEQGIRAHGLDVEEVLKKLNEIVEKSEFSDL